jgi:hypothetical protein
MVSTTWRTSSLPRCSSWRTRRDPREYFNPHTRSGHGTREFGWSAALVLDVLEALENPSPEGPQRS